MEKSTWKRFNQKNFNDLAGVLLANRRIAKNGCWIWTRSTNQAGYGHVSLKRRLLQTHRVAYRLWKGRIRKGKLILHDCDNPPCFNPEHLHQGTHKQNHREAFERGLRRLVTHCPNGHAYTPRNTYTWKSGGYNHRMCRRCELARKRRSKT